MCKPSSILMLTAAVSLLACSQNDGDSPQAAPTDPTQTSQDARPAAAASNQAGAAVEPIVLFSETLHQLPMPEPGRARVEIYGGVYEAQLLTDCSALTEPPPMENDWDQHRFDVTFSIQMDGRYSNISINRAVRPEVEGQRGSVPPELESVAIRTLLRGGQTVDLRNYALRRNRPGEAPRISRVFDQRPAPPQSADEVPGIRIHPDGRRVTFVDRLGRSEAVEESDYEDFEDIRIAIHCGPV